MPSDAPPVKIDKTRGHGAEVVLYDRVRESREEIGGRIAAERGAVVVPPFDDPDVIAGQGTCGIEIVAQAREQALVPDAVLVPCSGGGLTSGIAIAVKEHFPDCEIVTVEPVGFDDVSRSLAAGARQTNDRATGSICDALLVTTPGRITFEIMSKLVSRGLAISDEEVLRAIAFAQKELALKIEPGGAIALAALLAERYEARDRTVVAVVSGGNVEEAMLNRALLAAEA
jgi:threonine dehydratase